MAYKNQKKNKAHIQELKNDETNWRYAHRMYRESVKRKNSFSPIQKLMRKAGMV